MVEVHTSKFYSDESNIFKLFFSKFSQKQNDNS